MPNKVSSRTKSLFEIMTTSYKYSIPFNQRPYTWDKPKWETLWESIFSEENQDTFIGTLIFLEDEGQDIDIKQIYDGQQRITTLSIMFRAFLDASNVKGDDEQASRILRTLLYDRENENPTLEVSLSIREYFTKNFQNKDINYRPENGQGKIENLIFSAYKYFYDNIISYLDEIDNSPKNLNDKLIKRLKELEVVELTITDPILGIEIFESVNHRGEPLNAPELVKNILIKHAHIKETDINDLNERWIQINDRLSETKFNLLEFLHYFWISKYPYVPKNKLFYAIKDKFRGNSEKWLMFFDNLEASSKTIENIYSFNSFEVFKGVYKKAQANPRVYVKYIKYLKCLRHVKNKSWIIPIFTLLDYEIKLNKTNDSFISNNKLHKIFQKHFVFSFLHFNVFSYPTRDFTPAMYKLSRGIHKAINDFPQDRNESNKQVNECLKSYFHGFVKDTVDKFRVDEKEFKIGIENLRHKADNKFLIHTIFSDIEELYFNGTTHNFEANSIEHYMPQDSKDHWGIDKVVSKKHEDKLGNILIIDAVLNGKLQNFSHLHKLEKIKNHNSISNLVKDFIEQHEESNGIYNFGNINKENLITSDFFDNPSEIDKRTQEIAKFLKKIYIDDLRS